MFPYSLLRIFVALRNRKHATASVIRSVRHYEKGVVYVCKVFRIDSVEDALRMPRGKLVIRVDLSSYFQTRLEWAECDFSERIVRWAAKRIIKQGTKRHFSTQAALLAYAFKQFPLAASLRGYEGIYREWPRQQCCGKCNGGSFPGRPFPGRSLRS